MADVTLTPKVYISWIPMGVVKLRPSFYISWNPLGVEVIRPQLYITAIPGKTAVKADLRRLIGTYETFEADSKRGLVVKETAKVNVIRSLGFKRQICGDSKRKISADVSTLFDTERKYGSFNVTAVDTVRRVTFPEHIGIRPKTYVSAILNGVEHLRSQLFLSLIPPADRAVTIRADVQRQVGKWENTIVKHSRIVARTESEVADTKRDVFISGIEIVKAKLNRKINNRETIKADTSRYTDERFVSLRLDTSRVTSESYNIVKGTAKRLIVKQECCNFDTCRDFGFSSQGEMCTVFGKTIRKVQKTVIVTADTSIRVPFFLEYSVANVRLLRAKSKAAPTNSHLAESFTKLGIQSMSISLNELTLSDKFELLTVMPLNIMDAVKGKILDYSFSFLIEETSQRDLLQTAKGVYDREKTLYTAISIGVIEASVSYYANALARALGLKLHRLCDNFTPSEDYSDSGMTYADFVSSLFGWTSKLPQMQINAFIRDDTLHIIQRGHEEGVIDITNWPQSRPTIERKLMRTLWQAKDNDNLNSRAHNSKDDEPIPFTGTIGIGETSRTYENGYLVREQNKEGVTTYTYSGEYLSRKNTENKDGSSSETTYIYARTNHDIYLVEEHEKHKEAPEEPIEKAEENEEEKEKEGVYSERVTYHAPLGYGWYSTVVYVDGVLEGSSLSQGKSGGKASRFTINQSNLSLGSHYCITEDFSKGTGYSALFDTEFPVIGDWYLQQLTKELEWLNRKVQENITIEICSRVINGIPEIKHIVDFTERIRFRGNEYYLVSNRVEFSSRSFRQKIQMVRWY